MANVDELLPSAADCNKKMALAEAEKASEQMRKQAAVDAEKKALLDKLKGLLGPLGCHETAIPRWSVLNQQIPIAGIAHNCGTVRFGDDPRTSALDVNCKAHDVDNLYVVDTSFFPSSSAVNPALTAMANALRVGDHLIERFDAPAADLVGEEVMAS